MNRSQCREPLRKNPYVCSIIQFHHPKKKNFKLYYEQIRFIGSIFFFLLFFNCQISLNRLLGPLYKVASMPRLLFVFVKYCYINNLSLFFILSFF